MALVFTLTIPHMAVSPNKNGFTNCVESVHWRMTAEDGPHLAFRTGAVALDPPFFETFIPFEQLTREKVMEWIQPTLDANNVEQELEEEIARMKAPQVVVMAPPFEV